MAALVHLAKGGNSVTANPTTTSATGAELTDFTISWSDLTTAGFAAGDQVIFIVGVSIGGSSNNGNYSFRVNVGTTFAGSTTLTGSDNRTESPTAGGTGPPHLWVRRHTLVTNQNIYFVGQASTGTATFRKFSCLLLKWDDIPSDSRLYAEADVTSQGNAPTTYNTLGAGAATPAAGDWWLVGSCQFLIDATSGSILTAINDGTSDVAEVSGEGVDTADFRNLGTTAYRAGLGSGVTVRTRYRIASGGHDGAHTAIFGLRLNIFQDYWGAHTTNSVPHSNTVGTDVLYATNPTFVVSQTGPFLLVGAPITTNASANNQVLANFYVDSANFPANPTQGRHAVEEVIGRKILPYNFAYGNISAGTRGIDFMTSSVNTSSSAAICNEQIAVIFSLELASADGATVAPDAGSAATTGEAPTVAASSTLESSSGAATLTGFAPTVSVAADVTVTPDTGALTATGQAPTVEAHHTAGPSTATLAATGQEPSVSAAATLESTTGVADLTGFAPSVAIEGEFAGEPGTGSVDLTGLAPTVAADASVETQTGALAFAGQEPSVSSITTLTPSTGELTLVGLAPTITAASSVETGVGTATITGFAPTVTAASSVQTSVGAVTISGVAPTVTADSSIQTGVGSATITGVAPTVTTATGAAWSDDTYFSDNTGWIDSSGQATTGVQALALTGLGPEVSAGATSELATASLSLTGQAPTWFTPAGTVEIGAVEWLVSYELAEQHFTASPGEGSLELTAFAPTVSTTGDVTLLPGAGSLGLVGAPPTLATSSQVELAAGQAVITGFAPSISVTGAFEGQPDTGTLSAAGLAPTIAASSVTELTPAAVVTTGQAPTFTATATIETAAGAASLTGFAPTVDIEGTFTGQPPAGSLSVTGLAPVASAAASVTTSPGSLAVTGHAADAAVNFSATPPTATLQATGLQPATQSSHFLTTEAGSVAVTGFAPSVIAGQGAILQTQTGSLVIVGEPPQFAGHFTAVANAANLVFTGFSSGLAGENIVNVPAGSLGFTGYPPFIVHLPAPLTPVGSQDRQIAVTGRRRVFRVGRRGGSAAA